MRDVASHSLPSAVKSSLSLGGAYSVGLRYSEEMDRACRAMPIRWLDAAVGSRTLASNGGARAEYRRHLTVVRGKRFWKPDLH